MTSSKLFNPLAAGIPSATDPYDRERVRDFISHACILSTESFYNVVAVLAQDPKATTVLSGPMWNAYGRDLKEGARGIAVNTIGGPLGLV